MDEVRGIRLSESAKRAAKRHNLSQDEAAAIAAYTKYTYGEINGYLRSGLLTRLRNGGQVRPVARLLLSGIDKLPAEEGTFYRTEGAFPKLLRLKVGETIERKAPLSTSTKPRFPNEPGDVKAEGTLVCATYRSRRGRRVEQFSVYAAEKEAVLPPGKFRLVERERKGPWVYMTFEDAD
jgi:hypothetical protein